MVVLAVEVALREGDHPGPRRPGDLRGRAPEGRRHELDRADVRWAGDDVPGLDVGPGGPGAEAVGRDVAERGELAVGDQDAVGLRLIDLDSTEAANASA